MHKIILQVLLIFVFGVTVNANTSERFSYANFGVLTTYRPDTSPNSIVLYISGDEAWNKGEIDLVNSIVKLGALVVEVDFKSFIKNIKGNKTKCYYPAADFEQLSFYIQKKYHLKQYLKPILIGYSSGASLAYGILAQSPDNTFKGAIALGFSPEIEINKPLCKGKSLRQHVVKEGKAYYLEACEKLSAPFIVLNGMIDKVCSYAEIKKFMQGIAWGELVSLPNVGHGFSAEKDWLPQFIESYKKVLAAQSYTQQKADQNTLLKLQGLVPLPGDFPITVIPSAINDTLPMAFMISGDGGWTSFDQSLGESLAERGIPVVGLDSQQYFWNVKTPEETALEVSKAVEHYMQQWKKNSFILLGYSFGADIVPFISTRIPEQLKPSLTNVFSLSPEEMCDFEIHVSDMLDMESTSDNYDVLNEIKSVKSFHPVCIFGQEEDQSIRNHFSETGTKVIVLPGSHHYNDDFNLIANEIYKCIK